MTVLSPYTYRATVVRVVDGDSLVVDIDQGFNTWRVGQAIRLLGCNAREHGTVGALEARTNLAALLPPGTQVTLRTVKVDKYAGRYDAAVILADGRDLVEVLVAEQWAARWDGRGERPLPPWPHTA